MTQVELTTMRVVIRRKGYARAMPKCRSALNYFQPLTALADEDHLTKSVHRRIFAIWLDAPPFIARRASEAPERFRIHENQ